MPEFFWTAKCFESIIFLFSNSFWLKLFFNPNSIRPNIFWTQCFFTIQFFDKKVFWAKNFDCNVFWTQSSFGCYFLHRNFFIRNFYKPKILTQRFLQKNSVNQILFYLNIFWSLIFLTKNVYEPNMFLDQNSFDPSLFGLRFFIQTFLDLPETSWSFYECQILSHSGSILNSQVKWKYGKFQLARWRHNVALFC